MSTSPDRLLKLMAYADGELVGDELREAKELVANDPDAARFVAQLGSLGDFVRLGHEQVVEPRLAAVDLTTAVMAAVESSAASNASSASDAKGVSSLDRARMRRRTVGAGVVAAVALAASVLVMVRQGQQEAPIAQGPAKPVPVQMTATATPATVPASAGVEVEAVESAEHSVSVFYLPSANELSTSVVVWVDETGEK